MEHRRAVRLGHRRDQRAGRVTDERAADLATALTETLADAGSRARVAAAARELAEGFGIARVLHEHVALYREVLS